MSVYEKFTTTSAALAAFALGECRRHVEVGGHVIDLVQAMAEEKRMREDPAGELVPITLLPMLPTREEHDRAVAAEVAAWLRGGKVEVTLDVYQRDVLGIVEPDAPKPAPVCPVLPATRGADVTTDRPRISGDRFRNRWRFMVSWTTGRQGSMDTAFGEACVSPEKAVASAMEAARAKGAKL